MSEYRNWAKGPMLAILGRLLMVASLCGTAQAEPAPITLQVKPQRCISLHQGQVCYQKLTFHWVTPTADEFCLHDTATHVALTCWRGKNKTSFEYEFASRESTEFSIRFKGQTEELVKVNVQVSSVYQSPERSSSRWRLF